MTRPDSDEERMSERSRRSSSVQRTPSVASEADLSFYRTSLRMMHSDSFHEDSDGKPDVHTDFMDQPPTGRISVSLEDWSVSIRRRKGGRNAQKRKASILSSSGVKSKDSREFSRLELEVKTNDNSLIVSGPNDTVLEGPSRRDHLLECVEIFPNGERKNRMITRSYIINLAKEAEGQGFIFTPSEPKVGNKGSKKLNKRALRQQLGNALQYRDFRQVDPAFLGKPAIWVRRNAIIISLNEVRGVILYNRLFLFNEKGLTPQQLDIIHARLCDFKESSESVQNTYFEFCALEGLLSALTSKLEKDFHLLEVDVKGWTENVAKKLFSPVLESFRIKKGALNQMLARIRENRMVVDDLLDDDEEMASMYLTEIHRNPGRMRDTIDHEEVEMLLESYAQVTDYVHSRGGVLAELMDDAESLVELRLDALQNRLLLVNLVIQTVTIVIAFGSLITATFGMNMVLPPAMSELPSSKYYFYGVVIIMILIMGFFLIGVYWWTVAKGIYAPGSRSAFSSKNRWKHVLHSLEGNPKS